MVLGAKMIDPLLKQREKYELSILIPARNEMFLAKTIENILENIEADTEVIAILDGEWTNPPISQDPRVTVIKFGSSIGQRAATNQACRLSKAKYVMKVDAHCSFDKGFDRKMIEGFKNDEWTMIPVMHNLHAFDWVCKKCGNRWYQGPTPTHCFSDYKATKKNDACDSSEFVRDIKWRAKPSPRSVHYRFDNTMHFQYWKDFEKREEAQQEFPPTMSIQGSCFMLTRERYWELDICSETFGSWGQQGVEVACKSWLSGGEVRVNTNTWYAHLFRTQGGDFGFPYPNPASSINKNRELSRELFMQDKWEGAKRPFKWLLDRFAPVPDWDVSKGILYYSDLSADETILKAVQQQIRKSSGGKRIVSVTLKPSDFGDNIHLPLERGYLTMAKQILSGLRELETDVVFFCEHDVLYHPSHFDFIPPEKDTFYYNTNVWRVRYEDGHAIRTDDTRQLSGLCAHRDLLLEHFEKRVQMLEEAHNKMEEEEFNRYVRHMGFEPGTHGRVPELSAKSDKWESQFPNIDIRHSNTLTPSRWNPDQFRNKKYTKGWKETDNIEGWGKFLEFFPKLSATI